MVKAGHMQLIRINYFTLYFLILFLMRFKYLYTFLEMKLTLQRPALDVENVFDLDKHTSIRYW